MPKKKQINKKKFINMEITRVKMNPDQAVLSCCSQSYARGEVMTSVGNCTVYCPGSPSGGQITSVSS